MIKSLKPLALLALPLAFSTLSAQTTTDPVGVVKITIEAAPSAGATKLTAISATLRNSISYQGVATSIGAFAANAQPIETGVTTWTAAQWTTEAHLCYIENAAGAEEAYLITGMNETTGQLTLSTTFDITTRYSATPTYRIVKAHTIGSLFGVTNVLFHGDDRIYLWNGTSWIIYYYDGSKWVNALDPFTSANNVVVYPSEGIFIERTQATAIDLTFNGSVPTSNQISTISGPGLTFISSNYPVDTTLATMAIQDTVSWSGDDRLFIWNGSQWDSYLYDSSNWYKVTDPFTPVNNTPVVADSAIFIKRQSTSTEEEAELTNPLPYAP